MKTLIELEINGIKFGEKIDPKTSLLSLLRDRLGLTGTKKGCGKGHCGACTVVIEGKAKRSCLIPVSALKGKKILTIEGISPKGQLHPLQEAFLQEDALQCGYCTPGMIMAGFAFLQNHPNPTEEEIKKALEGNLCRCGAHLRIIKAIKRAALTMKKGISFLPEKTEVKEIARGIGHSVSRKDARAKVTGELKYTGDLYLEGMLYGKALHPPFPHANILKIDTSKAQKVKGVRTVLTWEDIPGRNAQGRIIPDQPVLCQEKVRYLGDAVALVAGDSEFACEEGCKAIKVEYQPLQGVYSPLEALKEDAPKIHPEGNCLKQVRIEKGDVTKGFSSSDVIVQGIYETPFVEHAYLEPEAALALPQEGGVTVYTGCQDSFYHQREIASCLGLPLSKVRVILMPTGGGFGGKTEATLQIQAALLALKTQKPVKMVYSREESFLVHSKRHAYLMEYKTGCKRDGTLQALEAKIIGDTGAYATLGIPVITNSAVHAPGPYQIPHLRVEAYAVFTNNIPAGAMRGFGVPQVNFASETQMEQLALRLKIDPLEFRLKNALKIGSTLVTGQVLEKSVGLVQTLKRAKEFYAKLKRKPGVGIGIASGFKNVGQGGIPQGAEVEISLGKEGKFLLKIGASELGQGLSTALAQIASEEMGFTPEQFKVIMGDTALTFDSGPTVASKQLFLTGNAVRRAGREAKRILLELAAQKLKEKSGGLKLSPQGIILKGKPIFSLRELSKILEEEGKETLAHSSYQAPKVLPLGELPPPGEKFLHHFSFGYFTQIAIVKVNPDKGKIKVLKIIAIHDVGRAINPNLVKAQIEGGCIMGMGYALFEKLILEEGFLKTSNFRQYKIPTFSNIPQIVPVIVEESDPEGPFGAKGVGEMTAVSTASAIVNAIFDATGIRINRLPALEFFQEERKI